MSALSLCLSLCLGLAPSSLIHLSLSLSLFVAFPLMADHRASLLSLPPPPERKGLYVPARFVGNLMYLSGHGPLMPDGSYMTGVVGKDLTLEQARRMERQKGKKKRKRKHTEAKGERGRRKRINEKEETRPEKRSTMVFFFHSPPSLHFYTLPLRYSSGFFFSSCVLGEGGSETYGPSDSGDHAARAEHAGPGSACGQVAGHGAGYSRIPEPPTGDRCGVALCSRSLSLSVSQSLSLSMSLSFFLPLSPSLSLSVSCSSFPTRSSMGTAR